MNDKDLVVDLSAAQALTDGEVAAWAQGQRVFISSVMTGMSEEREAVAAIVAQVGATPVWFERFGGRDDDPELAYLGEVASADIYVGVLGERYGRPLPSGYSATHAEYREAVSRGLRICVWAREGLLSGPQQDFLDEVRVFRTTGSYSRPEDLAVSVAERLHVIAAEAVSPWVKIGDAIIRARRVLHDGKNIRIEARVRDDAVLARVEGLRPGGMWRGAQEVRVTWAGHTEWTRVSAVETETVPGRGGLVTITGARADNPNVGRPALVDVALGGRSPDDMTELAINVAIFDAENPLGLMSFMAAIENPFELLEPFHLPEDVVEPIAHLLLTEALVGGGRAERITAFHVGPESQGSRRVDLSWLPRRRYTNSVPRERHATGEVKAHRRS